MAMLNTARFAVCCFLLLELNTVPQITAQISQTILNAGGLNALEVFHVAEDGRVMVRSELDIMTPLSKFSKMRASSSSGRKKKFIHRRVERRWPNAYVHYEITNSIRYYSHGIMETINSIMKFTCLKFEENDTATERIKFMGDQEGCFATVGYERNVTNRINLVEHCQRLDAVQHEILHALGVIHEHSRYDRDDYVMMDVASWALNTLNFYRASKVDYDDYGIEYDYRSIMHYDFSYVTPKDEAYFDLIGYYTFISFRDIKLLNLAYGCTEKLCCNKKKTCPFNGVVIPKDYNGEPKCQCWCHSGSPRNEDQLVLCSSLNKSMEPVYHRTWFMDSSLTEAEHETCKDLLTDCASYKKKGMCFAEFVKMKKMCTKTCNFCGKGQNLCMDHDDSCTVMAEAGVCKDKDIEKFMSQLCPKSCGQCTGYYSACDLQRAMEEPEVTITNPAAINGHWIMSFAVLYIIVQIV